MDTKQQNDWNWFSVAAHKGAKNQIFASDLENEFLCDRAQAVAKLRLWQRYGWGRLILGRRGSHTRFWVSSKARSELTRNGVDPAIETIDLKGALVSDGASDERMRHSFMIRPNFELDIALPIDFTEREAKRLCRFIEALPL